MKDKNDGGSRVMEMDLKQWSRMPVPDRGAASYFLSLRDSMALLLSTLIGNQSGSEGIIGELGSRATPHPKSLPLWPTIPSFRHIDRV
jgi:hypothetical protein